MCKSSFFCVFFLTWIFFAFSAQARDGLIFGLGTKADAEMIKGWDIDITPDGVGLPPGESTIAEGEIIYEKHCAACHGFFGEGVKSWPPLVGDYETLKQSEPEKTVGSYWPYATTLFDYIRRTMPFNQPRSLSDKETYAVTAYILDLNDLMEDEKMDADVLKQIIMPNRKGFIIDPRPDVSNTACMKNCLQ